MPFNEERVKRLGRGGDGWIPLRLLGRRCLFQPMARLKVVLSSTVGGIVGLLVLAMYVAGTSISRLLGKLMDHIAGIWQELGLGTHVSQVQRE